MKPKPEFDPDLAAPSRPRRPLARICGLLLLLAVVSVLALRSSRPARARQTHRAGRGSPPGGQRPVDPAAGTGGAIRLYRTPQDDRLVMMASPAIDPNMVHPAPKGIDEAMVIATLDQQAAAPARVTPPAALPGQPGLFPGQPYPGLPDAPTTPQALRPTKRR